MENRFIKILMIVLCFVALIVFLGATIFSAIVLVYCANNNDISYEYIIALVCILLGSVSYYATISMLSYIIWFFECRKAKKVRGYIPYFKRESGIKIAADPAKLEKNKGRLRFEFLLMFFLIFMGALCLSEIIGGGSIFTISVFLILLIMIMAMVALVSVFCINSKLICGKRENMFFQFFKDDVLDDAVPDENRTLSSVKRESIINCGDNDIHALAKDLQALSEKVSDAEIKDKLINIVALINEIDSNRDIYPSNKAAIRKFSSYYIPTTIKLVQIYISVQNKSVQTLMQENVLESIKTAVNNIYNGFLGLNNNMFEEIEMDVAAEISALNSVLVSDGFLADQNIFPIKND